MSSITDHVAFVGITERFCVFTYVIQPLPYANAVKCISINYCPLSFFPCLQAVVPIVFLNAF